MAHSRDRLTVVLGVEDHQRLSEIVERERKASGYPVTRSSFVAKLMREWIKAYPAEATPAPVFFKQQD